MARQQEACLDDEPPIPLSEGEEVTSPVGVFLLDATKVNFRMSPKRMTHHQPWTIIETGSKAVNGEATVLEVLESGSIRLAGGASADGSETGLAQAARSPFFSARENLAVCRDVARMLRGDDQVPGVRPEECRSSESNRQVTGVCAPIQCASRSASCDGSSRFRCA